MAASPAFSDISDDAPTLEKEVYFFINFFDSDSIFLLLKNVCFSKFIVLC